MKTDIHLYHPYTGNFKSFDTAAGDEWVTV
jgi:hypothetical protein